MDENGEEHISVVLGDAEIVDCDAELEGISEEDNVQYQICEFNRDDNTAAYRLVHVNESQIENAELPIVNPALNAIQVITSPISGQLYVLSNGGHVLATESSKSQTVASDVKHQSENSTNASNGSKKRDERRRVTHNEVERRRRDKINNWIAKLGNLLPDPDQIASGEADAKANMESQSKGGILARACQYITELREVHENYAQSLDENVQLLEEVKSLRQIVNELRNENTHLKVQVSADSNYILGS